MNIDFHFLQDTFFLALGGVPVTLEITLGSLLFAIPTGFFMAVANLNEIPVLQPLFRTYISFMRGTPMILQIYLIYNLMPSLLNAVSQLLGLSLNIFEVNPILYAFAVFALSETAVLAEVFRSALQTVEKGQFEAAVSIGFSSMQAYRRIVVPQALSAALPVMCNTTTDLIKATSLVFTMSVLDITAIAKTEAGMKLCWIEAYLDIFLIYLLLIITVEQLFKFAECKVRIYKEV